MTGEREPSLAGPSSPPAPHPQWVEGKRPPPQEGRRTEGRPVLTPSPFQPPNRGVLRNVGGGWLLALSFLLLKAGRRRCWTGKHIQQSPPAVHAPRTRRHPPPRVQRGLEFAGLRRRPGAQPAAAPRGMASKAACWGTEGGPQRPGPHNTAWCLSTGPLCDQMQPFSWEGWP